MKFIKSILTRLLSYRDKRIIYSIYFNFKHLPFHQAKHFPIIFFRQAYATVAAGGKIVLNDSAVLQGKKIYIGMHVNDFEYQCEKTHLHIHSGKIELNGQFEARRGCIIDIRGLASIGDKVRLGPRCRMRIHNKLVIGNDVAISHESQIFDTNFHYIEKVANPQFVPISRPISIGSYVWIGNRTTISPGTILPDFTICASNSLVNKDFSLLPPYSLIGGVPAKFIKEGYTRVWDTKREMEYHKKEFEWYRALFE